MQSDPQSGPFLPVRELGNKYQQGKLTAGRQRFHNILAFRYSEFVKPTMVSDTVIADDDCQVN